MSGGTRNEIPGRAPIAFRAALHHQWYRLDGGKLMPDELDRESPETLGLLRSAERNGTGAGARMERLVRMAFSATEWESLVSDDRFCNALVDTVTLDQAIAVIYLGLDIIDEKTGSKTWVLHDER